MNIICVGEIMVEMSDMGDGNLKKGFAGDTFNVAYYLKSYVPNDWNISYATSLGVGDDDNQAFDFIKSHNINTDKIIRNEKRSIGTFILANDKNGEKVYTYKRDKSAAKVYFDKLVDFSKYDAVYISGITAAITEHKDNLISSIVESKIKNPELKVVYDFNHRRLLWNGDEAKDFSSKITPLCDIIKISDEELPWIFGENMTMEKLSKLATAEFIFTKGADGAELWQNGKLINQCPPFKVDEVVDTSAAGDSFLSAYLWKKFAGNDIMESLSSGAKLAKAVLSYKGSILPKKTLPNLD